MIDERMIKLDLLTCSAGITLSTFLIFYFVLSFCQPFIHSIPFHREKDDHKKDEEEGGERRKKEEGRGGENNPGDDTVDGGGKGGHKGAKTREIIVKDVGGGGDSSQENTSVLEEGLIETAVKAGNVCCLPIRCVLARDEIAKNLHCKRRSLVKAGSILVDGVKEPLSKDVKDRVSVWCEKLTRLLRLWWVFFPLVLANRRNKRRDEEEEEEVKKEE